ncbi:hypothetical protein [Bremerella sp. P1]|uniref:hypothetical protein n=1 Tax=Bremerella sp. P1 TaxID=3026424 RepID=UPI002368E57C|nr:hypothetical protein [Bremerella sp. P1]WDI41062.1 hypothetical protein PSR63_21580 [Bremerella sp. P1]
MHLSTALPVFTMPFLLLAGCSKASLTESYPVTGEVIYNGNPVEGATVALIPSGSIGRSGSGTSDASGQFSITTYVSPQHQAKGAIPGDYFVTVSKLEVRSIDETGLDPQEAEAAFSKLGPPKNLLPKKYANPNRSGIKVKVTDNPPEHLRIELKD